MPDVGAIAIARHLQQELRSLSLVDNQENSVIRGGPLEAVCSLEGEV